MRTGIRILGPMALLALVAVMVSGCEDTDLTAPIDSAVVIRANPSTMVIDPNTQQPNPNTLQFEAQSTIEALLVNSNGQPLQGVSVFFSTTAFFPVIFGGILDQDVDRVFRLVPRRAGELEQDLQSIPANDFEGIVHPDLCSALARSLLSRFVKLHVPSIRCQPVRFRCSPERMHILLSPVRVANYRERGWLR